MNTDNSPWYVKAAAGFLGLVFIMTLALLHMIDGPQALTAGAAIVGVFIGSSALLGGLQSLARARLSGGPTTTATATANVADPEMTMKAVTPPTIVK